MANCTTDTASRRWDNWLWSLDRKARDLPRAASWGYYPYFFLVRYPRLRPPHPKYEARSRRELSLQSGGDAFEEIVAEWRCKIQSDERARTVLGNLTERQKRELAALTVDIYTELDVYVRLKLRREHYRELVSEGTRRQRMRERKLKKARKALEDLIRYEKRLPSEIRGGTFTSSNSTMLRSTLKGVAESALGQLPKGVPQVPNFRAIMQNPELPSFPKYPVSSCLVRLFWFFHHECKLHVTESCVRAGLLFNAFSPAGIRHVAVRESYHDAESGRCPAVYQAAGRFKLTTS